MTPAVSLTFPAVECRAEGAAVLVEGRGGDVDGAPPGAARFHDPGVIAGQDGADGVPAALEVEDLLEERRRGLGFAPIDEDECRGEAVAEETLPGEEGVDVVLGGPGFEARGAVAAGLCGEGELGGAADAPSLDLGEEVDGIAVEDEVEGLESRGGSGPEVGKEGLAGLIDGDIGAAREEIGRASWRGRG